MRQCIQWKVGDTSRARSVLHSRAAAMHRKGLMYCFIWVLVCLNYAHGRSMHQTSKDTPETAAAARPAAPVAAPSSAKLQHVPANRKLASTNELATKIGIASMETQKDADTGASSVEAPAATNSSCAPATDNTLSRGAPTIPMPAAIPFQGSGNATYRTYSMELGASINGTRFIPGACGPNPSALGYQCSWPAPDGVVIHWSYNVSHPPINRCTQNHAVESAESLNLWSGDVAVHFALQAASRDKLHFTFVDPSGRFFPSEGVHGWGHCAGKVCAAESPPEVQVLYYDSPGRATVTGRRSPSNSSQMEGWASWVSADFDQLTGVLCFSRKAYSKSMRAGANILHEAHVSYAVNNRSSYTVYAPRAGVATIDFRTGKATKADLPMTAMAVHGALMIVAFAILLPSGLLVVRHKWLFMDQENGGSPSPLWALTHMILLIIAAACAVAGMIVALVAFGNNETGVLMSTHQVLGLICIGMTLVLVVMYGLRPFVKHQHRGHSHPLLGPQKISALLTVLGGWTTLFLGCAVVHYSWAVAPGTWVVPCAIFCACIGAACIALELRFQQLVRTGVYNPKTFTLNNIAPLPLARIKTGREQAFDAQKYEFPTSYSAGHGSHGGSRDGTPGSARSANSSGIAGAIGAAAAAALNHRGPITTILRDASRALRSTSSSGGSCHSPGGTAENLIFRRGRQSSAASSIAGGIATGFPSTPGERTQFTNDNC